MEFAKKLLKYCQGELSKEDEEEVRRVVERNPELKALVEELRDKERIGETVRLLEKFDAERALRKVGLVRSGKFGRRWWWAAASVALVAGVAALFYLRPESKLPEPVLAEEVSAGRVRAVLYSATGERWDLDTLSVVRDEEENVRFSNEDGVLTVEEDTVREEADAVFNKVEVPYGGIYSLVLADGTKVYLNSGSSLEFPSRFGKKERLVKVSGEAYFEVAKNKEWPFVVSAGETGVKVLGTEFNVKSYADEAGVYTTLVEGSVAILRGGKELLRLRPGEQSYYNKGVGNVTVKEVDTGVFTAWKDGMFYFKDMTLGEILKTIARWYDVEVFYVNAGVQGIVYNGKMPMYSGIGDVLRKFELSGEVRFELNGRTLTVYEK